MTSLLQKCIIVLLYIWICIKIGIINETSIFANRIKICLLTTICLMLGNLLAKAIIIICNKRGVNFNILFGYYQLAPFYFDEYCQKYRNGYESEGYLEDSDEE